MSSDYITRLRSELLRAGATEPARWRGLRLERGLRPLVAAAALALVVVAVVLALPAGDGDERPTPQTSRLEPFDYQVPPGSADQVAEVLRARLATAEVPDASVSVPASDRVTITAPAASRADVTALTEPGRLEFYDWEPNVLGPRGTERVPQPKDVAEARAAGRPDGRIVEAEQSRGWFAISGDPALTNAAIARAVVAKDYVSKEPVVAIDFTPRGHGEFESLTRAVAQRGRERAAEGAVAPDSFQHFAIIVDGRVVAMPYINYQENPDGVAGAGGAQISGGFTPATARRLAGLLCAGPLPAALEPDAG